MNTNQVHRNGDIVNHFSLWLVLEADGFVVQIAFDSENKHFRVHILYDLIASSLSAPGTVDVGLNQDAEFDQGNCIISIHGLQSLIIRQSTFFKNKEPTVKKPPPFTFNVDVISVELLQLL